jgi:hypothetical protein
MNSSAMFATVSGVAAAAGAARRRLLEKHRIEGGAQTTLDKNRWLLEVAFNVFGTPPWRRQARAGLRKSNDRLATSRGRGLVFRLT